MKIIEEIKKNYQQFPDLNIREYQHFHKKITIIYLESLCSSDKVNQYFFTNIKNNFHAPGLITINQNDYQEYLNNGYLLIIDNQEIKAIEVKSDNFRSITTPETQISINGPKDSFNENFLTNLGLIRKRLKTTKLKIKEYQLGKYTKTTTGILYIEDIVHKDSLNKIINILDNINTDSILDSSNISEFIEKNTKKAFAPLSFKTERPDYVCGSLLKGKVVILVDNTPYALILPATLIDFINPPLDDYSKPLLVNALKILRISCFILTLTLPAFYIALTNYNQESIPLNILVSLANARRGVPFPSFIEALIMLSIYEILRESDIHFPKNFGSANSILGALILGDASVKAGIVSPIMIIIIAITFISSLIFTDNDFINAIRHYRLIFLLAASFLGLYGIMLVTIYYLTRICSLISVNIPYTIPVAPFNLTYFKHAIRRVPIWQNKPIRKE